MQGVNPPALAFVQKNERAKGTLRFSSMCMNARRSFISLPVDLARKHNEYHLGQPCSLPDTDQRNPRRNVLVQLWQLFSTSSQPSFLRQRRRVYYMVRFPALSVHGGRSFGDRGDAGGHRRRDMLSYGDGPEMSRAQV